MSQFRSYGYVALSVYAALNQTCGDTVYSQSSCNPTIGYTYNFNYTVRFHTSTTRCGFFSTCS